MNTRLTRRRLELLWSIKDIFAQATLAWIERSASTMGAALVFYTVFSVAPISIIAIGVIGLVIGADTVRADLLSQMQGLFGDAGASTVFVEPQNSRDRIWGIPKRNQTRGLLRILRSRSLFHGRAQRARGVIAGELAL